jgi:hypothetical protein
MFEMRTAAFVLLVASCGAAPATPNPIPGELPRTGSPTAADAPLVTRGTSVEGDVPYQATHHVKIHLEADERLLIRVRVSLPGSDAYPTTRCFILDAAGATRQEWRSSLWKSEASFVAPDAGDYVFAIQNAQFPELPDTIHYIVALE